MNHGGLSFMIVLTRLKAKQVRMWCNAWEKSMWVYISILHWNMAINKEKVLPWFPSSCHLNARWKCLFVRSKHYKIIQSAWKTVAQYIKAKAGWTEKTTTWAFSRKKKQNLDLRNSKLFWDVWNQALEKMLRL